MLWSFMLVARLMSGFQPIDDGPMIKPDRVRGMDALTRAVIDEGCRRSSSFADLVQDVERSKFIVYVDAVPALDNGMQGVLLHHTNEAQYLRINLRRGLQLRDQVAVLAHELQHVREVILAGISADAAEMAILFRRIGNERLAGGRRQQFETFAALRAGELVAAELRAVRGPMASAGSCRPGSH